MDPRHPAARLAALCDADSVAPLHEPDASGALAAAARIHGHDVIVFATDPTIKGGALGVDGCRHIAHAIGTALDRNVPCLGLWHSGGARLPEGVAGLHAVGEVFARMVEASGRIPQLSLVLGPAAGGAAYGPALTDVVIMSPEARVFVTGPQVIAEVTGEQVDMETLGGPHAHSRSSGVCHIAAESEADAFASARSLVDLLADQGSVNTEAVRTADRDLASLLPESRRRAYDVHPLIESLLDRANSFVEIHGGWARSVVVGLGRLGGRTVGVVANNPLRLGGCLTSESAEKAARFVRWCDAFGIPLVVLVDVPGYLPGVDEEHGGVVRRGAKLLHAFAEATVPAVTLVTRKIYGGAYIAMNSRSLGAHTVYAWPGAEVAVMGARAAVTVLKRRELAAADTPEEREELMARFIVEQEAESGGVGRALEVGVVDAVIEPSETRSRLAAALAEADHGHRGTHTNIPL